MSDTTADGQPIDPRELVAGDQAQVGIPQFVTDLKTVERQVGEHVIAAMQQPNTVAVLSTVVPGGPTSQRLISVPLPAPLFLQVQQLLEAHENQQGDSDGDVPCIGFQCVLDQREHDAADAAGRDHDGGPAPETQGDQPT
jgi:hypothetical protein